MNATEVKAARAAISKETLYWGLVTRLGKVDDGKPYMEVPVPGFENQIGVVYADEVDAEIERKTLMPLLGRKIPFVVIGVEKESNRLVCSRRLAQNILKSQMAQKLANQDVLHGEVINAAPYGVYIEVDGISGLLKNADYINVAMPVSDFLHIGNKIDVICKSLSPAGKIQWAPAVKPKAEDIIYDVEVDTVILGTAINLKSFPTGGVGVFVRISRGLDALCLLPPNMEVEPGDSLTVKINLVEPVPGKPPRVKGKILRVM